MLPTSGLRFDTIILSFWVKDVQLTETTFTHSRWMEVHCYLCCVHNSVMIWLHIIIETKVVKQQLSTILLLHVVWIYSLQVAHIALHMSHLSALLANEQRRSRDVWAIVFGWLRVALQLTLATASLSDKSDIISTSLAIAVDRKTAKLQPFGTRNAKELYFVEVNMVRKKRLQWISKLTTANTTRWRWRYR